MIILIPKVLSIEPFGASVVSSSPERAAADSAGTVPAQAGNVTELTISGYSVTQSWQGYFGNITGTIQLADANDNSLYNWTLASPQGEIYASLNNTISWNNVQCFNFTANGTGGSGGEVSGATNLGGINLTTLEAQFNIGEDDVDGVNETFYLTDHDEFYTSNLHFSANECRSTRVYGNGGPADQQFEEVLLYEYSTGSFIFTALLEEDLQGFDSAAHDFEMLVLEDGHGTDTASSSYYFYVELE